MSRVTGFYTGEMANATRTPDNSNNDKQVST